MGYQYWPAGSAPYTPYTYVIDRRTLINHQSIMDGLARDVGWIQHNINTTHLFASGYARPTVSGFFKNIDTNFLYVNNLYAKSVFLYNIIDPKILSFDLVGDKIDVTDSAFVNNNITVSNTFHGPNGFSLSSTGFTYNPIFISGGLYDYYMQSSGNYRFQEGLFGGLTLNSGNITLDNNHRIILESLSTFAPSGQINEDDILWNQSAGHNHIDNKINSSDITDATINYNDDLILNANDGSLYLISGILDADFYNQETYYEPITFYELEYASSGIYTCDKPVNVKPSGRIKDLDIGTCPIISYNGKIYATSRTAPSSTTNLSEAYIYSTEDFYNWSGVLISGTWFPDSDGIATVDAFTINFNSLYLLWNMKAPGGNYCSIMTVDNISLGNINYKLGDYAHGSSRYGLGLASVENNLSIFGYEYPHVYGSGIPKWDKSCLYWEGGNISGWTSASAQDSSYANVPYQYSYPFIQMFKPGTDTQYFWLDGSIGTGAASREAYLTSTLNGELYTCLSMPQDYSGYFGSFFGNGFSEITSIISTDIPYHNGQRAIFTTRVDDKLKYPDVIDNYSDSPLLVFGNSTINVNTTKGSGIFGGCVPLVLDIDKRILPSGNIDTYLTPGNVDYAPYYLHGSRSLLNDVTLYRIPQYHYWHGAGTSPLPSIDYIGSIINSNLFNRWPTNSGRLWTDFDRAWPSGRTELINLCPYNPGVLVTPFGGKDELYYKHSGTNTPIKLSYTTSATDTSGLIIPSGTFPDHRNYPTYYDRVQKDGFWSTKTFDWWYMPPSGAAPEAPSGAYSQTHYYMRPKHPIQHNGIIYCILEFNTGFIYLGPNGTEYIDDGVMYSDLVKFGNTIYGVGTMNNNLTLRTIKRNVSSTISLPTSLSGVKLTPKFVVHLGLLYIGIGNGRFLVKKPSHTDICITSNL